MDVTDKDVANVRRISEDVFGDKDCIELVEVKASGDNVMVSVRKDGNNTVGTRNAFAGSRLRNYHENGYVAVAVGGGNGLHSAWFERAGTVEFGEPPFPEDEYDLFADWKAIVEDERVILGHHYDDVVYIPRDGWKLDRYVLNGIVPSRVADKLLDVGFEKANVSL
jgi:hypothetical protein